MFHSRYFLGFAGPMPKMLRKITEFQLENSYKKNGNQIAQLSKGTRGRALAESTDSTGRIWWFIEIDPNEGLSNSAFGPGDYLLTDKPKIVGWISSRFVKRL